MSLPSVGRPGGPTGPGPTGNPESARRGETVVGSDAAFASLLAALLGAQVAPVVPLNPGDTPPPADGQEAGAAAVAQAAPGIGPQLPLDTALVRGAASLPPAPAALATATAEPTTATPPLFVLPEGVSPDTIAVEIPAAPAAVAQPAAPPAFQVVLEAPAEPQPGPAPTVALRPAAVAAALREVPPGVWVAEGEAPAATDTPDTSGPPDAGAPGAPGAPAQAVAPAALAVEPASGRSTEHRSGGEQPERQDQAPALPVEMAAASPKPGVTATDTTATPTALPSPLDIDRLMESLARTAAAARPGRYSVRISLHPEQLGEVKLRLVLNGRDVAAIMEVASPAAKEALEQRGDALRRGLDDAGLNLTQFDVSTGQGDLPRHQDRRPQDTAEAREQRPNNAATTGAPAGAPAPAPASAGRPRSGLDVIT